MQSKWVIPLHYIYSKVIIGDQNDYEAFWISNFHNGFSEPSNISLERERTIHPYQKINLFNADTTVNAHKVHTFQAYSHGMHLLSLSWVGIK